MFKKKYHGGLKAFLLLLFIMLLGLSSISYARDIPLIENISSGDVRAIFTYISDNISSWNPYEDNGSRFKTYISNLISNDSRILNITQFLQQHFNENQNIYNTVIVVYYSNNFYNIAFLPNNNGYGEFNHIMCTQTYNNSWVYYYYNFKTIDDNYNNTSVNYINISCNHVSNLETLTNPDSVFNVTISGKNNYQIVNIDGIEGNFYKIPFIFGLKESAYDDVYVPNATIYSKFRSESDYSWIKIYDMCILPSFIYTPSFPQPSGDSNSGESIVGQITNNSGEVTGSINLKPIEDNLNRIEEKIPSSGDIAISVSQANENYWGSGETLSGDEQKDIIENSINEIMDTLSGELLQNSVFNEMENAENIFLDFFRNQEDESFYDLIISWDTISPVISMYNGSVTVSSSSIISGDSINISALCRNNSTLSQIQQYIRIIFNFSCTIALVWQVYNLILSTLGIDNPYLYEDADVTDVVNPSTGEAYSRIRSHRRVFRKWW